MLRRREAAARGEDPGPPRPDRRDPKPDQPDDNPDQDDEPKADRDDDDTADRDPADADADADDREPGEADEDAPEEPRRIDEAPRRRRRRSSGGPNDGGRQSCSPSRPAARDRGLPSSPSLGIFLLFSVGTRPVDRCAVVRAASASTPSSGRG